MWHHLKLASERLREVVGYDSKTGAFTKISDGADATGAHSQGYRVIRIDGKKLYAHRLAWLYTHGHWPAGVIDHINGDRSDNRLSNLRDVSHKTNLQNMKSAHSNAKAGLIGACWDRQRSKWKALIRVDGKSKYIGIFATADEAHRAYLAAKRRLHEGCTI